MSIVDTIYGKIEGKTNNGLAVFLGVPYAAPPIGELRFRAPQPPQPWDNVIETKKYGGSAPQDTIPLLSVGDLSEDCLYLNIWTPAVDGKKRAVLFWIHGGGFFIGSGAQREFSGSTMAERGDVVLVTINYRLGALGFAHFPEILGDSFDADSNLGIRDQIAALQWVRDNIDRFGGDPNNVTLFGESAGGMSVGTLMGTPSAEGLFHKAIPQSGAGHHCIETTDATKVASQLLNELKIDKSNAHTLRKIPYADFIKAQRKCAKESVSNGPWKMPGIGMVFVPVIDNDLLSQHPTEAIQNGLSKNIALMIGTTAEEWKLFSQISTLMPKGNEPADLPSWLDITEDNVDEALETQIPGFGKRLAKSYRETLGKDISANDLFIAIETDRMFTVPASRLADAHVENQDNIYMYRFDFKSPTFGACHAIDLPLVFGTTESPLGMMLCGGGDSPKTLSIKVQNAWLAFAKKGNPSHEGLPMWPRYCPTHRATMIFDIDCHVEDNPGEDRRKPWQNIYY